MTQQVQPIEAGGTGKDLAQDAINVLTNAGSAVGGQVLTKDPITGDAIFMNLPDSGDVVGPSSSGDSHIALFDSATGKLIKDSGLTLSDVTAPLIPPVTTAINDFQVGNASGSWVKKTLAEVLAILNITLANLGGVATSRSISTTSPLTGGGNLTTDRTIALPAATASNDGYATSAQVAKLDGIATGAQPGTVTAVFGTAPIASSGGNTPAISISTATTGAAGSMSAADKTKLDGIAGNGWIPDSNTWTYVSSSSFTVTGNKSLIFTTGMHLRWTQTTVKFGVVSGSSYGAGVTTVRIVVNTDYVIANAAITLPAYSFFDPPDWPGWFTYAPTFGGFSPSPTGTLSRYNISGGKCIVAHYGNTGGTSNATSFTVLLPIPSGSTSIPTYGFAANAADNGVNVAVPIVRIGVSVNSANLYTNSQAALWTASGTKRASFIITYEI